MDLIYPDIAVQLTGKDGNAFFVIGRICAALRRGGVSAAEIDKFTAEATNGDYDNLLRAAMRWVNVT